jgi:hypothetical protein
VNDPFSRPGPRSLAAWLTWAAATAAAVIFVLLLGSNVPYWDEWELVPAATGHQRIDVGFLWSLHNEHRIPLAKLVYLALFAGSHDFRSGALFQVLALAAASALLIEAARRVRGRGRFADGVFALLLLHPGHAENLIWSFQIAIVLFPVFLAITSSAAAGLGPQPSLRQALAFALPLLVAPLCGAPGVVLASVGGGVLLWLGLRVALLRRHTEADEPLHQSTPMRAAASPMLLVGLGLLGWLLVALYLYGYHGNPGHPAPAGGWAGVRGVGEVLSMSLGPAGGWNWRWTTPLVALLVLATGAAVALWWWRSKAERLPAEALLGVLAATGALVVTIGWGRSGFGPGAGFAGRYAALSAPLLCWACLAWCRLPWPRAAGIAQLACWTAAAVLYPANFTAGRELAEARRAGLQALVHDLRRPLPLAAVAARHTMDVYPDAGALRERLEMLRPSRLGPFSRSEEIAALHRRFRFLDAPLVAVRDGAVPAHAGRVHNRRVVVLHADGDLVFDARPGVRHASGYFGLGPEFSAVTGAAGEPKYDGTCFIAWFRSDEGREVDLFRRVLDPLHNAQDRGLVPFRLDLPSDGGQLVLSTRAGPPGVPATDYGDWGFWSVVELR